MGISPGLSQEFARAYLERVTTLLTDLNIEEVARVIDLLLDARRRDATIFLWETVEAPQQLCILPMTWGSARHPRGVNLFARSV
jgi:hypothetical protein